MLTGFDPKWINTLYLDKIIEYENIIQAFSRTNQLEPGKSFSDYVAEYVRKASDDLISFIANSYGLDEVLLREMKLLPINEENLDEYVRFNRLRNSVDKERQGLFFRMP